MGALSLTGKYSHLSVDEMIRQAEHENNELALRLIGCFEEATDLEAALADALTEVQANVTTALENMRVVLQEEEFDVSALHEEITELVLAECDDEGLPAGLSEAIEAVLKRAWDKYAESLAEVWPNCLLETKEALALKKEVEASSACIDVPKFWTTDEDFENPFQDVLDAKKAREAARKRAEKEARDAFRINQPVTKRKPRSKKS